MPPNVKKTSFRHLPTRTPTYRSKRLIFHLKKIPWIKRRMPLTHKSEPLAGEASPVSRSEKVHQKGLKKKSNQTNSRNWTPDIDGQNRQCRHTCKCRLDWIQMLPNKMEFLIDKISSDLKIKKWLLSIDPNYGRCRHLL